MDTIKKLMLIVNPVSGRGKAQKYLYDIIYQFTCGGYRPTVYITQKKGEAAAFAAEAEGYDLVACLGGDGTLSEVASGLMKCETPPPLGYIPTGTANDVATTLELSRDPLEAVDNILCGTPVPLDIGTFNGRFFVYIAAFGAFTEVSYSTSQDTKNALGHMAYILSGLAQLGTIAPHHVKVEYDDGVIEGEFIFGAVMNSSSIAGLIRLDSSVVELGDGLFEVMLIRDPEQITDLSAILRGILSKNYDPERVVFLHTSKVKFTFDYEVAWTTDGESGGMYQEALAKNNHAALRIIV